MTDVLYEYPELVSVALVSAAGMICAVMERWFTR
jgi:hypothetical protein